MIWISRLASLKLTFGAIVFLLLSVLGTYLSDVSASPWLISSLLLLALNLFAAIATNRRFRKQMPLLLFHLALFSIVALVAIGRLTYLKGKVEVLEGEQFDGHLISVEAGPLHPWGLDKVHFVNLGFRIAYAPGRIRLGTENRVASVDESNQHHELIIGDQKPLVLNHYRFYTTPNKGFALLFEWYPNGGNALAGSVNLPSYPTNALKQAQQWTPPGLPEPVWTMLQFEGDLIPEDRPGEFRLPTQHTVVVRYKDQRWELAGRQSDQPPTIDLPQGQLRYLGLHTWMGYQVTWDRTVPWLLVAAAIAVLSLGWHFWQKFASRPWSQ